MAIVRFSGHVHPKASQLKVANLPGIDFHEPPYLPDLPTGLDIQYKVSIDNSRIEIECDVKQWTEELMSWVFNRAHMAAYSFVDLFSFASGVPHELFLDKFTYPDGTTKDLMVSDPRLPPLCTFAKSKDGAIDLGAALLLVMQHPDLHQSLRDLIRGVSHPNFAVIDCARTVEGLRHIFEPDTDKRSKGWGLLQDALNITRDYREYVTDTSAKPRHGDKGYISGTIVTEVTQRAWTIMNRFIEYRLRNVTKLPLNEFPLL